jgi:hypothetical protein
MGLGSGIRKKPIPDTGCKGQKKAPDPGSSATLGFFLRVLKCTGKRNLYFDQVLKSLLSSVSDPIRTRYVLGLPDPDPYLYLRSGSGSSSFHQQMKSRILTWNRIRNLEVRIWNTAPKYAQHTRNETAQC